MNWMQSARNRRKEQELVRKREDMQHVSRLAEELSGVPSSWSIISARSTGNDPQPANSRESSRASKKEYTVPGPDTSAQEKPAGSAHALLKI